MDAIQTYGNLIKKAAPNHPAAAFRMIKTGLALEHFRTRKLADRRLPEAFRFLNSYAVADILDALRHPERTVWANIFSPVEILQCFGVHALSIEALSSFLSGFTIEDYFMNYAEEEGIAGTLCSYHKNFIGAVDSGVIPPASFAVTTSTICDGNINTFRHLAQKHQIPSFLIDVPMTDSPEAHAYVTAQLKELIARLEAHFHKPFRFEALQAVLDRENRSRRYYEEFLRYAAHKSYPSTLTLQMYMLFATHTNIGEKAILRFFHMMRNEIREAPEFHGTKILWVHLLPYYQETLKQYFNLSEDYQIQTMEMNFDYRKQLDIEHPLDALADKMINNVYTRSYERKAQLVCDLARTLHSDGVINFCHWGCKQSSGGVMLLKEKMREMDLPFLILDGDGMARINSHDGQIRTRLEAFLELLDTHKKEERIQTS
ncbi:MAG: 2-hydroxyacyl-CoA dehydratase family protein [Lachnospiraceae bacterium]|jgi:benzoyl-CoA reductase/2-hydroxyglutaryl-CoA dehydratase subunit BcrC/BadD/HgdB|nr:2-hydroxyacyl-CoA dehydratase family protein [Lachnospiraceae bacterium]MCI1657424.1 2-hydroxyacyl-CoA dehydratase family protein [Lachnospiraceae bacterium]